MAKAGKGKRSPGDLIKIIAAGLFVVLAAGSSILHLQNQKKEAAETARLWTVSGPVCPTAPPGAPVTAPPRTVVYEGVSFSRERGPLNCNTIRPNGEGDPVPVCMFPVPGALRVATANGTVDYALRPGEGATVYVRDGEPECVLAVNSRLFNP